MKAADAGTLQLGNFMVSRMGFGAMRVTGPGIWGWPADRDNARNVLRRAVQLGVNFIDTADSYGPDVSELLIAEALYPYPKDLVIATKGGLTRSGPDEWHRDCRPERIKACCEASLRRLKLDAIPVYQLHAVDRNVPFEDQIGALADLQAEGKIVHAGVSNESLEQLQAAQKMLAIVSVQNRYNLQDRGDNDRVLEHCEREGLAFLPWYPLAAGDVSENSALQTIAQEHNVSPHQIALAWLLARSKCILPIPGTQSIEHLEENIAAAAIQLSEDDLERLNTQVTTNT